MSHKIKASMDELQAEIKKLCEEPITYRSAERIVTCHKAYKIMCEMYSHRDHEPARSWDPIKVHVSKLDTDPMMSRIPPFDRQMAMEWTAGMVNADGTKGPHWTTEETDALLKQYGLKCDSIEFWAVMNSLYSDYCEALRLSSASTPEVYVRLAKAWIHDQDAVPNKAAAYFAHIVKH